jgi:UDPglucose--hexose-1-phosphate uridylyltransferase
VTSPRPERAEPGGGEPELRRDEIAGRWVAIAPARASRPGGTGPVEDELESCPFCAGREDRTPPETLRLGGGPTGWGVRVVPNLFPALERQEVVVHGPLHKRSLAELDHATLDLVALAWQRRARDAGGTVFPIVNEGRDAGASLPHSHSQLAWLPGPPPGLLAERGLPETVPFLERDGVLAGCPLASRVPYELQVAPARPEPDGLRSDLLAPALRLLAELVRRLHHVLGAEAPFNVWLHEGPHWHLELVPRTTRLAGLELGAGVWINPVPPESAAAALAAAGG